MISSLFVMLFLVAMVIFIVYHFYIDYSNWSNTGNTFAEGMGNNGEKVPQKGTFISNEGRKWENQIPFKVSKNIHFSLN